VQLNLCRLDRIVRVSAGGLLALGGLLLVKGWLGVAIALFGALLIFSGFLGFCHVYKFLGLSSAKKG